MQNAGDRNAHICISPNPVVEESSGDSVGWQITGMIVRAMMVQSQSLPVKGDGEHGTIEIEAVYLLA